MSDIDTVFCHTEDVDVEGDLFVRKKGDLIFVLCRSQAIEVLECESECFCWLVF